MDLMEKLKFNLIIFIREINILYHSNHHPAIEMGEQVKKNPEYNKGEAKNLELDVYFIYNLYYPSES